MHPASTGYSRGNSNARLAYTISCGSQPMGNLLSYHYRTGLVPIPRSRMNVRLRWSARDSNQPRSVVPSIHTPLCIIGVTMRCSLEIGGLLLQDAVRIGDIGCFGVNRSAFAVT